MSADSEITYSAGGRLTARLQKAGFPDVKVLPDSFVVRADDRSGNVVMMSITPDSMTELTKINASGQNASGQNESTSADGMFTSIPTGDRLSSTVIGLDVYNDQNQDIGTIKDMAMNSSGLSAYIVGSADISAWETTTSRCGLRPSASNTTPTTKNGMPR